MNDTIYIEKGFTNRQDYLENLADEHGTDQFVVLEMADILGESEDFTALYLQFKT